MLVAHVHRCRPYVLADELLAMVLCRLQTESTTGKQKKLAHIAHLFTLTHDHVQVDGLEEGCKSISTRLVTADADMRQFTERAQLLRRQRGDLSKRADQVTEFLHRFQLSEVVM
jgi:malate/lactate dehydrogenase